MWRIQLLSWIKPSYQGAAEVTFNIKQKRSQQDAVDSWPPIIITWHHHERRWIIYLDCIYDLIHFTFSAAVVVTLLLTISSILALVDDGVPGTPGRDYPVYDRVPPTLFSCYGKVEAGFYADPQTDCQGSRRKKNVPLKYNDFKGIFSLFQPLWKILRGWSGKNWFIGQTPPPKIFISTGSCRCSTCAVLVSTLEHWRRWARLGGAISKTVSIITGQLPLSQRNIVSAGILRVWLVVQRGLQQGEENVEDQQCSCSTEGVLHQP